ncbi:hypothetical protein FC093_16650 [Ilyomonas limi]|uniref:Uncharacterized protein n=1 Tax=Ilyomonas limi TaxID=2575867 RepID=A0A4U3KVP7_9BACT|nr:hypothetical protein [Ilyomonas limi]TKK66665.1 hypothetical protein FC093_16650 [Ilyomonas limi]
MYDKPVSDQHKEYANKIVGTWYNRIPDEILTFSFLDNLTEEADLLTRLNGKSTKATYNLTITFDDQWYLQIWSTEGKKNGVYRIEILTDSIMMVSSKENKIATYQRKVDYAFANQLLDNYIE